MKYICLHKGFIGFIAALIVVMITACTNDTPVISGSHLIVNGESFTVTGSISVPDMQRVTTRGTLNEKPNDGLVLTVFEFDLGENAESSFLSNIYTAELLDGTGVDNVKFNLTLKSSASPKVLHFMLADKPLTAPYGSVASILSTLSVGENVDDDDMAGDMGGDDDEGGGMLMSPGLNRAGNTSMEEETNYHEAYWGYVEFPNGYIKTSGGKPLLDNDGNMIPLDDIATNLRSIPLIRNFARISVTLSDDVKNFRLIGFKIVNVPTSGTIGPWDTEKQQVPTLLYEDNDEEKREKKGEMKKYSQIDYKGMVPGDADFGNQEAYAKFLWEAEDFYATSAYIYEHPYESTRRSYLIVYGIYSWTGVEKDEETGVETEKEYEADGFYKIDIGKTVTRTTEENEVYNIFEYYNIIRNIHYNVVITKVEAKGCSTVAEAIAHAPFNNISASTETSSMLNMSDGHNLLILNKLNHIIVDDKQKIDVLYRYIHDVIEKKEKRNDIPKVVGLTNGDVIKSFTKEMDEVTVDGAEWKKITLEIKDPTSVDAKTQSFSIVGENGLSRTVNITLRKPWRYPVIGKTDDGQSYYATVTGGDDISYDLHAPEDISSKQGENFTVYFNLPEGLDDKMFPLVFQLESKAQGIENNKIGTLVVTTGPSLFNSDLTTISYLKKVSYEEYLYKYNGNTNDLDKSQKNSNHTIRCRFTTIMDAELDDAEIKIHNPYFSPDISAKFKRVSSSE